MSEYVSCGPLPEVYADEAAYAVVYTIDGQRVEAPPSRASTTAVRNKYESLDRKRNQLLAVPSDTSGIDMALVHEVEARLGHRQTDILCPTLADFRRYFLTAIGENQDVEGVYLEKYDIVAVPRGTEQEAWNGPAYTASLIIHELGHRNRHACYVVDHTKGADGVKLASSEIFGNYAAADGVLDRNYGRLLAEAAAEFQRGRFVARDLQLPYGFVDPKDERWDPKGLPPQLGKYCYRARNASGRQSIMFSEAAVPAALLEVLIDCDPRIEHALRWSPFSLAACRDVAYCLDGLVPDLYRQLMTYDYRAADCTDLLRLYDRVTDDLTRRGHVVASPK